MLLLFGALVWNRIIDLCQGPKTWISALIMENNPNGNLPANHQIGLVAGMLLAQIVSESQEGLLNAISEAGNQGWSWRFIGIGSDEV